MGIKELIMGPAPPPAKPCQVLCPPERHIPIPFQEIYNIVKKTMTVGQRQRYEEVCQLVESLFAQDFMTLRRNIKLNFRAFSSGAKGQDLPTRKDRSLPPKADLDIREERLVSDFLQLMAAARYHIITEEEWNVAMEERFMFHLPVKVNWDYFDAKLLTNFWASNRERSELRALLPPHADRILVFHRGIGVAEDSGLFISQKIDLLVEYIVVIPLLRIWAWLCVLFARLSRRKTKQLNSTGAEAAAGNPQVPGQALLASIANAPHVGPTEPAKEGKGLTEEEQKMLSHRAVRVVERRTIKRLLPTVWRVIKNFHKPLELQEPMYKELVVLYRTSGQGRTTSKSKVPVRARSNTERLKDILMRRNVHVKCFHDIPMADMEVIFPDKKVYMKTISMINMVIQGITAFVAALAGLRQAGHIDLQAVWSALSVVAARIGQLYSGMQAERSEVVQNMVNILYDKTNDAQEGVISMLLEDMAEQQVKEAVLAYTMLYMNIDDEITEAHLDELCEDFLEKNFDCKLDFAVEDALPNLVQWGMVRFNKRNQRFQALPVEVAYQSLIQHWMKAYEALSRPPKTSALPLRTLLGQTADEGEMYDVLSAAVQSTTATVAPNVGSSLFMSPPAAERPAHALQSKETPPKTSALKRFKFMFSSSRDKGSAPTSPDTQGRHSAALVK